MLAADKRHILGATPLNLSFFNVGAVIGAIIGAVLMVGVLAFDDWDYRRRTVKFGIWLVVLGYIGGSLAWSALFERDEEEPPK
jgi:hypothetical protein